MPNQPNARRILNARTIIVLVLMVILAVILLTRRNGDDRRAPSPTPIFEGVDKIAP